MPVASMPGYQHPTIHPSRHLIFSRNLLYSISQTWTRLKFSTEYKKKMKITYQCSGTQFYITSRPFLYPEMEMQTACSILCGGLTHISNTTRKSEHMERGNSIVYSYKQTHMQREAGASRRLSPDYLS